MSDNKITISFDEEKPLKKEEKIIIEIGTDINKSENAKENLKKVNLTELKINSFYKGNSSLTSFSTSELTYPSGIENGFSEKFSFDLKDVFLNSILENNQFIITSSKSGCVYFIDRITGVVYDRIFFENESFEKTGIVIRNTAFINSLNTIYKFENTDSKKGISDSQIYSSGNKYIIWSNLNYFNNKIVFTEYSPELKTACLKIIDVENNNLIYEYKFLIDKFISDSIAFGNDKIFILSDDKIHLVDTLNYETKSVNLPFHPSSETIMFFLNDRLFLNNHKDEIIYLDMAHFTDKFRYSGINSAVINSVAGFDDNIFLGNSNGWEVYKFNGSLLYNFEDISENKIEFLNKNILAVSIKNRIVFHNLNRFQEAEGLALISNEDTNITDIISSAIISVDGIFVLTRNGYFKSFNNDKLNLQV